MKCSVKFSVSALEDEILTSYKSSFACVLVTRVFDSLINVKYFVAAGLVIKTIENYFH